MHYLLFVRQGRKKASKASAADEDSEEWEAEREKFVKILLQLLQLNVQRLWDPPIVEEEFVRCVTVHLDLCEMMMKMTAIATVGW